MKDFKAKKEEMLRSKKEEVREMQLSDLKEAFEKVENALRAYKSNDNESFKNHAIQAGEYFDAFWEVLKQKCELVEPDINREGLSNVEARLFELLEQCQISPHAFLVLSRLLLEKLQEEKGVLSKDRTVFSTPLKLLLARDQTEGKAEGACVCPGSVSVFRSPVCGVFLNPISLGSKMVDESMQKSIAEAFKYAEARANLPENLKHGYALELSIFAKDFNDIKRLEGESAGTLFACAFRAALEGKKISKYRTSSCVIKPGDWSLGSVDDESLVPKLLAASNDETLCRVYLEETQAQKYQGSSQLHEIEILGVGSIDELYDQLAGEGSMGKLFGSFPEVPKCVIKRREYEEIRKAVLSPTFRSVSITSAGESQVSLHGPGGIGKSLLAALISTEIEVRQAFPDGIFWFTLGREAEKDLSGLQARFAKLLTGRDHYFSTLEEGKQELSAILSKKQCLLILDDVWKRDHVQVLGSPGGRSCFLITTRCKGLLEQTSDVREIALDVLTKEQALELLSKVSGGNGKVPSFSEDIVKKCGYRPLDILIVGSRRKKGESWERIWESLKEISEDDLLAPIEKSIEALDRNTRKRYLELAVFKEDAEIPEETLEVFWGELGYDLYEVQLTIEELSSRHLLSQSPETGRIKLHDRLRDYVRGKFSPSTTKKLHKRLCDSYKKRYGEWHRGPEDGYFFENIAYHFSLAGNRRELLNLLFDYKWLERKLEATSVSSLLADCALAQGDPDVNLLSQCLTLSAPALSRDKTQLASQLIGRLGSFKDRRIKQLCKNIKGKKQGLWLRPLRPTLESPGGPLLMTLCTGSYVNGAILLENGRKVLCWCNDGTLRLWDIESGKELRRLVGHEDRVLGALLFPDGKKALSWSHDRTLRLWDIETGKEIRRFEGHEDEVNGAFLFPGGKKALSWSNDWTLRLWDIRTGEEIRRFEGHKGSVNGALIFPDGEKALSWSQDGTLRLWGIENGKKIRRLKGHKSSVEGALLFPDAKKALSWSWDNTLRLWDIERGKEIRRFEGHEGSVLRVLLFPDGTKALSWSTDKTLRLWDIENGMEIRRFEGHEYWFSGVLVFPDGKKALSWSDDKTLRLWDIENGDVIRRFKGHRASVNGALIFPDGKKALSWSRDGTLRLWDIENGMEIRSFEGHEDSVLRVLLLPEGKKALSWSMDNTLRLWDIESGKEIRRFEGHEDWILGAHLFPHRKIALSWSTDKTFRIWDIETGREIARLEKHNAILKAILPKNSGFILLCHEDLTIIVSDAESREALTSFSTDGPISCVAVSPDEKHVFVGEESGRVHFLRIEYRQPS